MITEEQKQALITASQQIQTKAYAPYSRYLVGAALLGADGTIYTGVNVENVSYGLTICAERTAVTTMVTAGVQRIQAVAVCGEGETSPCGACRQVLAEFIEADVPVYLTSSHGDVRETTLLTLLPLHFGSRNLERGQDTISAE